MTHPQPVLDPLSQAALVLVVVVDAGGEDTVRDLLPDVAALRRSVGFRAPDSGLSVIVGIGSDLWDRMIGPPRPAQLHDFVALDGNPHAAPATPGDLMFHIRARSMDLCFELGRLLLNRIADVVHVVDETHGFRFFDERDLLGFVDGTENPEGDEAAAAALVGAEDSTFAGGSYVVVQKYQHDLAAWDALTVEDQERAIGRSKLEDVEMADDEKPANSHVHLNDLDDNPDGSPREIVRANMPFGSLAEQEFGTYFIGYAGDLTVTEQMLRNMFLGKPAGTYDRILDFSRAVTGSVFFCPNRDFLDDPPDGR